jgi:hydroxymethylglutaryl-CoA lyase
MFEALPERVSVYEVSLRDGLQNEAQPVPIEDKLRLLDSLVAAGLTRIELTSFVSPRWVPQLADAEELVRAARGHPGVTLSALCPNAKGLERARAAGLGEVAVFLSASETHNYKNTNKPISRSIDVFSEMVPLAIAHDLRVRGYISTVWGCPYEGAVSVERTVALTRQLLDMGCYQISLGDTIGVGTPRQTAQICDAMLSAFSQEEIALHLHDTRGTALANALVGLSKGITTLDASIAGIGGCPYAPGAAGNLATEDLVYMLHGMGIDTGIDIDRLLEAGRVAERVIGRALPGKVHQAGMPRVRF